MNPDEQQDEPLSIWESIALYSAIGLCGVSTLIVAAGTLGYLYITWVA